ATAGRVKPKSLFLPTGMAGGCASTRTASARFLIKRRRPETRTSSFARHAAPFAVASGAFLASNLLSRNETNHQKGHALGRETAATGRPASLFQLSHRAI